MLNKSRVIILLVVAALAALALTGCAGVGSTNSVTPVDNQNFATQLQFIDGIKVGPKYNAAVSLPQDWVGKFKVRSEGNKLYFDYITASGSSAPIFFIEALSKSQYWQQNGAHPGSYTNIINRGDTYFIYHLPIDSYYSGLPKQEFGALAEAVPGIISSFTAEAAE